MLSQAHFLLLATTLFLSQRRAGKPENGGQAQNVIAATEIHRGAKKICIIREKNKKQRLEYVMPLKKSVSL